MNISPVLGKTLVFAGLSLAVVLGIRGLRSNWTTVKLAGKSASITELDQRARPFFEEAQRNVPAAVAKLTESKTLAKICWLEVRDKASGSQESQKLVLRSWKNRGKGPRFHDCRGERSVRIAARWDVSDMGRRHLAESTVLHGHTSMLEQEGRKN